MSFDVSSHFVYSMFVAVRGGGGGFGTRVRGGCTGGGGVYGGGVYGGGGVRGGGSEVLFKENVKIG